MGCNCGRSNSYSSFNPTSEKRNSCICDILDMDSIKRVAKLPEMYLAETQEIYVLPNGKVFILDYTEEEWLELGSTSNNGVAILKVKELPDLKEAVPNIFYKTKEGLFYFDDENKSFKQLDFAGGARWG